MFRILAVLMIAIPIIEIWGLLKVGQILGVWETVGLVLLTGIVGAYLAKREGAQTYKLVRMQLNQGQLPGQALLDGICILVGGTLLLTPGFFTDAIGFLLLIPYTRGIVKAWLMRYFKKMIENGSAIIIHRR